MCEKIIPYWNQRWDVLEINRFILSVIMMRGNYTNSCKWNVNIQNMFDINHWKHELLILFYKLLLTYAI